MASRLRAAGKPPSTSITPPPNGTGTPAPSALSAPPTSKPSSTPSCRKPSPRSPASLPTTPAAPRPDSRPSASHHQQDPPEHAHQSLPNGVQTTWPTTHVHIPPMYPREAADRRRDLTGAGALPTCADRASSLQWRDGNRHSSRTGRAESVLIPPGVNGASDLRKLSVSPGSSRSSRHKRAPGVSPLYAPPSPRPATRALSEL